MNVTIQKDKIEKKRLLALKDNACWNKRKKIVFQSEQLFVNGRAMQAKGNKQTVFCDLQKITIPLQMLKKVELIKRQESTYGM